MLKRRTFWIILAGIVLMVAASMVVLKQNRPEKPAVPATAAQPELEFLPTDVAEVKLRDLRQILRLSGSLRAVNQAAVKAKVAGEVREVPVREGETVKAGQVLVKMDTSEYRARLEQAKGALLAARGQLEIAAKARDNNKALLEKGFISKTAFDNAESQFDIAQANVESAKGALDVAQKSLNDTVIRAPISGLVSSRTVQPGEKVSADNRLLEVVDLQRMEMEAAVPTSDIMSIAAGQEVLVKVEGLADPLSGKVVRINPSTQAGSRSVLVYIQVDNPQGRLRVGMFGEAQLTLAKKTGVLTIPQSAVQGEASSPFVYAVENGRLARKPVMLGIRGNDGEGDAVEVVKGLEPGALVVNSNLGRLDPGTAVKFLKASRSSAAVKGATPDAAAQ
jgi:membrane fusion protein (multidrug efflux system)